MARGLAGGLSWGWPWVGWEVRFGVGLWFPGFGQGVGLWICGGVGLMVFPGVGPVVFTGVCSGVGSGVCTGVDQVVELV